MRVPFRISGPTVVVLAIALTAVGARADAQSAPSTSRSATRAQLEASVQVLERTASSTAYGERTRAKARAEMVRVRSRLANGDFTVGQRIWVRLDGQPTLFNDTLTVRDSLYLDIPNVRRIPLGGVLRSELEAKVTAEVAQVVRDARVQVWPLTRVAVLGSVTNPGFFQVPSQTLLDHLITLAGGPTSTSAIERLRVMRSDTVLMQGPAVLTAIAEGKTLDELDLRDGDALMVPQGNPPWDRASILSIAGIFLAPLITILVAR